jgi:hypothetical protein
MNVFFLNFSFIFRRLIALEEENAVLLRNLNAKEETLRNTQVYRKFSFYERQRE